jgi:hypothetical protein
MAGGGTRRPKLVEVELTQKARPRVVAALKTRPPHTARLTYYIPANLHAALAAQLASVVRELGGRPEVRVELLPQLPGVSYLPVGVRPHELASRGPEKLGRLAPHDPRWGHHRAGWGYRRPLYDNQLGHRLPTGGPPAQGQLAMGVALGLFLLSPLTCSPGRSARRSCASPGCAGGSWP